MTLSLNIPFSNLGIILALKRRASRCIEPALETLSSVKRGDHHRYNKWRYRRNLPPALSHPVSRLVGKSSSHTSGTSPAWRRLTIQSHSEIRLAREPRLLLAGNFPGASRLACPSLPLFDFSFCKLKRGVRGVPPRSPNPRYRTVLIGERHSFKRKRDREREGEKERRRRLFVLACVSERSTSIQRSFNERIGVKFESRGLFGVVKWVKFRGKFGMLKREERRGREKGERRRARRCRWRFMCQCPLFVSLAFALATLFSISFSSSSFRRLFALEESIPRRKTKYHEDILECSVNYNPGLQRNYIIDIIALVSPFLSWHRISLSSHYPISLDPCNLYPIAQFCTSFSFLT